MKFLTILFITCMTISPVKLLASGEHKSDHQGHESHDTHDEHEHHEHENKSEISEGIANRSGINTTRVTEKTLRQAMRVYGRLDTAPHQVSHVRARFSGVIDSVNANIGDEVNAGDLLATVESNESLKKYAVVAPIAGKIIQRHANPGEVTREQVLFSIASLDSLWLKLPVFPEQRRKVKEGQGLTLYIGEDSIPAHINYILPSLDGHAYQTAWVKINNPDSMLAPGYMVEADIITAEIKVHLAVEKKAMQTLEGKSGVFIKEGESYHFTPLEFGRSDQQFIEVVSGLRLGDEYVTTNSFLLKADIEKSEAEHQH